MIGMVKDYFEISDRIKREASASLVALQN